MSKLDDWLDLWVDKVGGDEDLVPKQQLKDLFLEIISECDPLFGNPDGVVINRKSLIQKVDEL
jgi:hypothetical protein